MRRFDGLHSSSTGRTQADNCNDLLCIRLSSNAVSLSPTLPPIGSAAPRQLHSIAIQPETACPNREAFFISSERQLPAILFISVLPTRARNSSDDYSFRAEAPLSSIGPTCELR